jgi:hypothetical protein
MNALLVCGALRHQPASARRTDLPKDIADILATLKAHRGLSSGRRLTHLCDAACCLLAGASKPTQPTILLLNQLRQDGRSHLHQRRLRVAATQPARCRCVLQQGFFALLHHRGELWRALDLRNGLLVGFWPVEASQCALHGKRIGASSLVALKTAHATHAGLCVGLLSLLRLGVRFPLSGEAFTG